MRVDLRVKHDVEARKAAIGLFELGHGYKSAAIALSLPAEAVRRWQEIYRAFGSEVLLRMDGKQGRYTYEQRAIDAATDVLSFPMLELTPGVPPDGTGEDQRDPETGLCPLGDMVISVERAQAQAAEFGHSVQREMAYLAVHSVLHLLGYDHLDEGPQKAQMRAREEAILGELGIGR